MVIVFFFVFLILRKSAFWRGYALFAAQNRFVYISRPRRIPRPPRPTHVENTCWADTPQKNVVADEHPK